MRYIGNTLSALGVAALMIGAMLEHGRIAAIGVAIITFASGIRRVRRRGAVCPAGRWHGDSSHRNTSEVTHVSDRGYTS